MTTYISILRGINVSGQKLIKMDALKAMYTSLGFSNIKTYVQSGNVIFCTKKTDTTKLSALLVAQIKKDFDFDVPILVMTVENLQNIINANPFTANKDNAFLHITFLAENCTAVDEKIFEAKKFPSEAISFSPQAVYLYCPDGYGKTKLTNTFIEQKLKIAATTRNWKTTNELFKLATI